MEAWFAMVVRQMMLYSFPLLLTYSVLWMIESSYVKTNENQNQQTTLQRSPLWHLLLPFMASLLFGRAVIFSLFQPLRQHSQGGRQDDLQEALLHQAMLRAGVHLLLCWLGWILYAWALDHAPAAGLPPLHHWWAKVLMYLNLCLLALHLLPLPDMVIGELLLKSRRLSVYEPWIRENGTTLLLVVTLFAASPLADVVLGNLIIFPVYEWLASVAT